SVSRLRCGSVSRPCHSRDRRFPRVLETLGRTGAADGTPPQSRGFFLGFCVINKKPSNFERPDLYPPGRPRGRFASSVRRFGRTLGTLVVMVMGALLISQHLLRPVLPTPEASALAEEPHPSADEDTKKLVVCFGFADLDGGITSLHPT